MIKIHNTGGQQNEAWFKLRTEFPFTASNATAIRVAGKGLETLVKEKLEEKFFGRKEKKWGNEDTDRGNRLEPQARALQEMMKGIVIKEEDFITNEKYKYAGASPDGISEILHELKAPSNMVYAEYLENPDKFKKTYYDQCQFQMMIIEKDKNLLTGYNPNFKQQFIEIEIGRDEVVIEEIKMGLIKAQKMWEDGVARLEKLVN